ncbi:Rhotekin-2 [Acipenser ruthenus]|uniref:Rhotekin-2 n=1 Tax=Acipenser ruthenus TaxID=7906 RepID=A0A444UHJ9_ACIRT|nr:Rhotekin-2 [Acipenser ruthenus]
MAKKQHPRDFQNFKRNERSRATVSGCSSLGMEIKRKKIRESTYFLEQEDCNIQEKIDFEIRMRDGAHKLLAASTQRDQVLNASKNLMTCNMRIMAYMTELQKKKEEQIMNRMARRSSDVGAKERTACKGKVALSGLRIPLMWKDSDHFSNKGRSRRVAVFCLMKLGSEVFDTEMVVVDKAVTDICFGNLTVFNEAGPGFELQLQVYSCCLEEEPSIGSTPKKLAKKLGTSLGKSTGKRVCQLLDGNDPESFLQSNPLAVGAKYNLLAYTTLTLPLADGSFQSQTLTITENEDSSFWLPLYGNICCCLVAQPVCMTQDSMSGFLNQQQAIGGVPSCSRLYCVLRGGSMFCYYTDTPEEIEAKVQPAIAIPVNKETRIRAVDKNPQKRTNSFTVINRVDGEAMTNVFTADCREELQKWMEAFWQHFYDLSQWKHCCKELMKIEIMSPKRPSLFLTKQATSVYHDISIDSPIKPEGLTDIIHNKIEETGGRFLVGQEDTPLGPHWGALFEGTHNMVVQKNVVSPSQSCENLSPNNYATKKRQAPPPPPDRLPYKPGGSGNNQADKENSRNNPMAPMRASSLESKFSSIIQQLQRPTIPPRKNLTCNKASSSEDQMPEPLHRPVPAPRQRLKSFKDKLNPKRWGHTQD